MNRIALALLGALSLVALTGCAAFYAAPVMPPPGFIYAQTSAIIDIDAEESSVGGREGRATSQSILGLVAQGDASLNAAAEQGGLTTVNHIDYEFFNILGVYSTFTTVAIGE